MERGDLTGAILDGRYRVIEPVAQGAMGTVYRAERVKLGRIVAVKVLHDVLPHELSGRKRFEIEAMAMAKLEHPHCASVLDVGVHNDRPFVVMDFVSGQNLKDLIAGGPQPVARSAEIVRQVLSGLAHAHENSIIHRDIKPANLVLSQKAGLGDHVKILDFGLARLHDTGQNLTSGIVVGTPAYMAPEQVRGDALDSRVDLYACGVLLFELLTGEKPFHSENDDPIEVCRMHLQAPIPRLLDRLPEPELAELEPVVAKALAKDRDERYASAEEFAAALEFAAARRPSRPLSPPTPPSGSIKLATSDFEAADSLPPTRMGTTDVLAEVSDAPAGAGLAPADAAEYARRREVDAVQSDAAWDPAAQDPAVQDPAVQDPARAKVATPVAGTRVALATPPAGTRAKVATPVAGTRAALATPAAGMRVKVATPAAGMRVKVATPVAGTRMGTATPAAGVRGASTQPVALRPGLTPPSGSEAAPVHGGIHDEPSAPGTFFGMAVRPPTPVPVARDSESSVPSPDVAPSPEAPPSRDAEARRARWIRPVAIAAIALGAAGGIALWLLPSGHSEPVSHVEPPPPVATSAAPSADAPREIAARATDLAAQGDRDAALDLLHRSRRQYPSSAVLPYTAGRLCFARFFWSEGLRNFRDAIRLEPGYRTDPELIKTLLRGFITTPSYNEDIAGFLHDEIGGPAQPFLEETARDHPNAAIRARASAALRRYR